MAETTIFDRLAAAQKNVKNPKADSEGHATASRTYGYSSLACVEDIVRPACNAQGLFLSQRIGGDRDDMRVITSVSCGSERIILDSFPLQYNANSQQFGSAVTYAKRYSLLSVFGISSKDDDDDGAASDHKSDQNNDHKKTDRKQPSKKQKELGNEFRKAKSAGLEITDIKRWIDGSFAHDMEDLTDDEIDVCINHIEMAITDFRAPIEQVLSDTDIPF